MSDPVLTEREAKVFEVEKRAMALGGFQAPVLMLASAVRAYRAAARGLLSKRYRDGECDAVALGRFEDAVNDAEEVLASVDLGADWS